MYKRQLLSCVVKFGPLRPADLAAVMKMEPSTLTRNLRPLLAANWARVLPGVDGRSRMVEITDEGRTVREQARRHWRTAQDRLNRKLGVQRVAALHGLIQESLALLADQGSATADGSSLQARHAALLLSLIHI